MNFEAMMTAAKSIFNADLSEELECFVEECLRRATHQNGAPLYDDAAEYLRAKDAMRAYAEDWYEGAEKAIRLIRHNFETRVNLGQRLLALKREIYKADLEMADFLALIDKPEDEAHPIPERTV